MRLESEEADGKSQIPAGHHNLLHSTSNFWGRNPVRLPPLKTYEARYTQKAVAHPQKHVQHIDTWVKGHKAQNRKGDTVEHRLNTITDPDKGGLPHSCVEETGKVGESRCQQKRIYQLHTKEEEYVP